MILRHCVVIAAAAALVACERTPTTPAGDVSADGIAALASTIDGLSPAGDKTPSAMAAGGSLDGLLHQAIEKLTREKGKEAASKLLAPLNQLLLDAAKAMKAGDTATARVKLAAARTEEMRIIVAVLGADPIATYVTAVADRAKEVRARIESLARTGYDVTKALATLATVDADVAAASAALKATPPNPTKALDLAAQATDLLNGVGREVTPPPAPPTTPKPPAATAPAWSITMQFGAALAKITHDQGEAAAKAIRAQVAALQSAAEAALKAHDTTTANAKLAAIRTLEIQTIVTALGKPAVDAAIAAVDAALADVRKTIDGARRAGKNVNSAAEAADKAAALLKQAQDALGKGQLASAFDLASQAGEWVTQAIGRLAKG